MSTAYRAQPTRNNEASLSAILASHLQQGQPRPMDGRQSDYPQSGLHTPSTPNTARESERSSVDPAAAAQYQAPQDYKPANFSSSATPNSEYGVPQSARSGTFPEYVQRGYADGQQHRYPASATGGHAAMAQTSNPSIAQSSPTYPPPQHYSPYPPQHEMQQYQGQPMAYGRPDWAGHYQQPVYGHAPATSGGAPPNMIAQTMPRPPAGGHPLSTVYSFVPIPGAQQHKRPRRRYEEIERMYKCGWNGCEKAYGTLNHLNAHVTMQSHGTKRTPEEFKEIRKEWKTRKKEEDAQRKQEDERARQEAARNGQDPGQPPGAHPQYAPQPGMMQHPMGGPQLPPIGYQPAGQPPAQYAQPQQVDGAPQYGGGQPMYSQGYAQGPYAQQGLPYQQHQAPPPAYQQQ